MEGKVRPSSESDITVDASPPAPGTGIGQKRRAESPTESLAPSDTEVRQTGAEKSVKKQHACTAPSAALCVGPVNAGGDGQSITVEMRDMFENFRHELRTELKTIVTDSIAETIGQRLDSLEVVVNEQRQDINRLSAENRRLKAAIEKCTEDVVISENGAKSPIAEVKQTVATRESSIFDDSLVATFTARHPVANLILANPPVFPGKIPENQHSSRGPGDFKQTPGKPKFCLIQDFPENSMVSLRTSRFLTFFKGMYGAHSHFELCTAL